MLNPSKNRKRGDTWLVSFIQINSMRLCFILSCGVFEMNHGCKNRSGSYGKTPVSLYQNHWQINELRVHVKMMLIESMHWSPFSLLNVPRGYTGRPHFHTQKYSHIAFQQPGAFNHLVFLGKKAVFEPVSIRNCGQLASCSSTALPQQLKTNMVDDVRIEVLYFFLICRISCQSNSGHEWRIQTQVIQRRMIFFVWECPWCGDDQLVFLPLVKRIVFVVFRWIME